MEPDQFDRAAALYREEPVVLYYLDYDPTLAAQYACDVHVASGLLSAATMLSAAWHQVNPECLPMEAKPPYPALFSRHIPPARQGEFKLCPGPDAFYPTYTGGPMQTLLGGQRIVGPTWADHANCAWARSAGGNYRWVHAWGVALAAEHRLRFNHPHRLTPMLWTLEEPPPYISGCEEATEPRPLVPEDSLVLDKDGFFDAPASYRTYYNLHKQPLLQWTHRSVPVWAQPKALG